MSCAQVRLERAVRIMVALLVALSLVWLSDHASQPSAAKEALSLTAKAYGLDSFYAEAGTNDAVPAHVEEELFSLNGFEKVRASPDAGVYGFETSQSPDDLFAWALERLEEQGWSKMSSGMENMATFVKEEGRCCWAYFSCASTAGKTVAVIQVMERNS